MARIAVVGGNGKTGRAVTTALEERDAHATALGRADWSRLAREIEGCDAVYIIAPNMHPDEPRYVRSVLEAVRAARVSRVVYHSVASPYIPEMPHHVGKAQAEAVVRQSKLAWTILQPGVYVQNIDLSAPVTVPYDVDAPFGFLDIGDLGEAAATVLLGEGHEGATYELASRQATVAILAQEARTSVTRGRASGLARLGAREASWFRAMFDYYDKYGLPVGLLPMRALLEQRGRNR